MRNSHICKYHRCKTISLCKHFTVFSIYWIAGFCTPDLSNCYRLKMIFEFNYKFKSGINSKLAIHFPMLGVRFKSTLIRSIEFFFSLNLCVSNALHWLMAFDWICCVLLIFQKPLHLICLDKCEKKNLCQCSEGHSFATKIYHFWCHQKKNSNCYRFV